MATYSFETITAAQALAITAADTLTMAGAPANQVTVLYNSSGTVTVVSGARAVEFGAPITAISLGGRLVRADSARLFVGDDGENTADAPSSSSANDGLYGGAGQDLLRGGDGADLLQGNAGRDTLDGGAGDDVVYGGQDNDRIQTGEGTNFGQGNKGEDSLLGGSGVDTLLGGQGNDIIEGAGGGGFLNGNLGDDFIVAGGGFDSQDFNHILGEGGNDRIMGGYGSNVIDGGDGDDDIFAEGTNTLTGGAGNDRVVSYSAKASVVHGGDGNDFVRGSGVVFGDDGDDTVSGQSDSAWVDGGAGNDFVGGSGDGYNRNDTLSGGEGADTLAGGAGVDVLTGGAGSDVFRNMGDRHGDGPTTAVSQLDRVLDWSAEDRIQFISLSLPDGSRQAIAATSQNYAETTANDFVTARTAAEALMQAGKLYVAVQVGADVVVFADGTASQPGLPSYHYATDYMVLIGRSLNDIDAASIVGVTTR